MAFTPDPNATTLSQVVTEFTKNPSSLLFDGFGVFNPLPRPDAQPDAGVSKFIAADGDVNIVNGKLIVKSVAADAGLVLDYSTIGGGQGMTGTLATRQTRELTFTVPNYATNPLGQGLVRVYIREERHPMGEYSHDYDLFYPSNGSWTGPLMALDFIKRVSLDPYHKYVATVKAGGGANDSIVVLTAIELGKNYNVTANPFVAITATTAATAEFGSGAWLKMSGIPIPTGITVADATLYKIVVMPVRIGSATASYGLMGGRVDNGSIQGINLTSYLIFDTGTDAIITKLSNILQGPTTIGAVASYLAKTAAVLTF